MSGYPPLPTVLSFECQINPAEFLRPWQSCNLSGLLRPHGKASSPPRSIPQEKGLHVTRGCRCRPVGQPMSVRFGRCHQGQCGIFAEEVCPNNCISMVSIEPSPAWSVFSPGGVEVEQAYAGIRLGGYGDVGTDMGVGAMPWRVSRMGRRNLADFRLAMVHLFRFGAPPGTSRIARKALRRWRPIRTSTQLKSKDQLRWVPL